jgi:hypothetical protein
MVRDIKLSMAEKMIVACGYVLLQATFEPSRVCHGDIKLEY